MVKTPFAENNQTWFLCTGILQTNINSLKKMEIRVSVAKKDAVISYKCSHQAICQLRYVNEQHPTVMEKENVKNVIVWKA